MKRSVEGYDGSDGTLSDHDPRRCRRLRPADNTSVFLSTHLRQGMCSQIPVDNDINTAKQCDSFSFDIFSEHTDNGHV